MSVDTPVDSILRQACTFGSNISTVYKPCIFGLYGSKNSMDLWAFQGV